MMKIQAIVIINDGAEMDAEKAIHNSETEKQTQTCGRTTKLYSV